MASQNLKINITAKDRSKAALGGVQASLGRLKKSIFSIQSAFIGLGAGLVVKGIFNAGAQIEVLGVQLEALSGSAAKGKVMLKQVTDFAKNTPFELKSVQQGTASLATVAKTAEKAGVSFEELLKITGNTAALLGGDFALAAMQVQRTFSAGIGAADLFRDKGIKAMAGFLTGVEYNTEESIKILRKSFGKGGQYENLTEALAQTMMGTISNLKDGIFALQRSISAGFWTELKSILGGVKKWVADNDAEIKKFGNKIGAHMATAMNSIANLMKMLIKNGNAVLFVLKGLIALKLTAMFTGLSMAIFATNGVMILFNKTVSRNLLFGGIGVVLLGLNSVRKMFGSMTKEAKIMNGEVDRTNRKLIEQSVIIAQKKIDKLRESIDNAEFFEGGGASRAQLEKLEMYEKQHAEYKAILETMDREAEVLAKAQEILADQNKEVKKMAKTFGGILADNIRATMEKLQSMSKIISESIVGGIKTAADQFARLIVFGEKMTVTLKRLVQDALVKMISSLIQELALMFLKEVILKRFLTSAEKEVIAARKKESSLRRQIVLQTILSALGGGGGGGGGGKSGFGFFAKGGAVSKGEPIVVGENGAEMFVPNQTGQITQSARGAGGSGSTSVTFNVNVNDASDFEEMLERSRGKITTLINDAVNERGSASIV